MKFFLAVMAVLVGIGLTGVAQGQGVESKAKPSTTRADLAPKSTVTVKEKEPASYSSSRQLKSIERQTPKGSAHSGQKARKAAALKPSGSDKNPPINFGSKGNGAGAGLTKQASPYKGRLKQKGAGRAN